MTVNFVFLISRQGKTRVQQWYVHYPQKEKQKIIREVTSLVLARPAKMCNFLEYRGQKVVYKRYASLFFIFGVDSQDNELFILELIHHYVEVLDRYFGNVCELDLIFNFYKAYYALNELLLAGEVQETSRKLILQAMASQELVELQESEGQSVEL
ncbi:AP-1 complex subunit sigma [Paratrimastix pyriformis]|uniref:AP complex subunit sigma n=1 Tax=Paratrimastix pyriformis TaxID=342808 RepID=A0ABQ9YMP2_9EUKA|nr:AP-1 complex subunit sigma [Paratrimastix pyriformis]